MSKLLPAAWSMTWVSLRGKPETTLAMQNFHVPLVWHKFSVLPSSWMPCPTIYKLCLWGGFSIPTLTHLCPQSDDESSYLLGRTYVTWFVRYQTRGEKNWTVIELICLHTTKCTHLVVSHFSLSVLLLEKSFVILGCLWFLGSHKMLVLGIHIPQSDGNLGELHKTGDGSHTKQRLEKGRGTQKKHAHHIVVAWEERISIEKNCELTRFLLHTQILQTRYRLLFSLISTDLLFSLLRIKQFKIC